MKIAILEDNADRVSAMQSCLKDRFPQYELRLFGWPEEMIRFLKESLEDVILISLDHDLELLEDGDGRMVDPGTGRIVVDYLIQSAPACPVVIHTTNSSAAIGMEMALQEAGWKTYRVVPYDDMNWIPSEWFRTVRKAIVASAEPASRGPRSPR